MTESVYRDIPRIYTALAEWMACMGYLVVLGKGRREWKFILGSAAALAVQALLLVLTDDLPTVFWIPCMLAAAGCMYLFLWAAGKFTFLESGYCCARAFLLAEFAASLEWQIHTYLAFVGVENSWLGLLLLAVIYGLVFSLAFRFEKPVLKREYLSQFSWRELVMAVGIVVVVFAFSNLSFVLTNTPFTSEIRADIFNIRTLVDAVGLAVLYAYQSRICEYMAETEVAAIQSMLKSQYSQYRNYQNSMELIHIKYHDLKHQIAGLRAETDGEKRKEWLDAMERELEANELIDKTGNQVLDSILGSKLLQARQMGISDILFLRIQHGSNDCPVYNFYDHAGNSGNRTCRYGIYVAPGEHENPWSRIYLEPAGLQCAS